MENLKFVTLYSGKNGQCHKFVYNKPIFNNKVEFKIIEKQNSDNYGYLIIK
ncbi:hypothetical protein [Clostridium sp. ZS1]|uniref:hypothetical protein n=1 Tax=Clostridium sp. ZS1 TaxID=2949989 RepID=UPI00207A6192|nr:hypothetical protein [Clostridium sp. ZS1]